MKKSLQLSGIAVVTACLVAGNALANGPDARSIGMGGANTAVATGVNAVFWNPANLANNKKVSIGLFQGAGFLSNNVLTGQDIMNISGANGATQTAYYDNLINAIPPSGLNGGMEGGSLEGVVWSNWGLTMEVEGYGSGVMSKDAIGFLLKNQGYLNTKMGQNIAATGNGKGSMLVAPVLTYANNFFGVDMGINVKPYVAGAYASADVNFSAAWTGAIPNPYNFTANSATTFRSTSPSGFGVDIGFAKDINENLRVGLVAQNLGGNIDWKGTQDTTTLTVTTDPATGATTATQNTVTANTTKSVQQNTTYRLGAAYNLDLMGPTLLTADYDMPALTKGGIHLGIEKNIGIFALRAGLLPDVSTGNTMFSIGTGLNLGIFAFDIGGMIGDGKTAGAAMSLVFNF